MDPIAYRNSRRPIIRGNRSGAAYVLALTTLTVGITFALVMMQSAGSYFLIHKSQGQKQMAADMAEAGIDYAYIQVNKRAAGVPNVFPPVNLASGSFSVRVDDIPETATMLITSTGTVKGTSYTMHRVTEGPKLDKTIDNTDPEFSCSRNWSSGTMSRDKYGSDYRWHATQPRSEPATWTLNLPAPGNYDIYAWWEVGGNRSKVAPYIIRAKYGQVTVAANQQANGGKWNLLGRWTFDAGTNTVLLSYWATSGYVVCADAIRVVGPFPP